MKTRNYAAIIAIIGVGAVLTATIFTACEQPNGNSTVHVAGVTLSETTLAMTVGEEKNLTATIAPSNATNQNVEWSSSAPTVVSVANGKITAKAAGSGTITVKTQDGGKIAACAVTVTSGGGDNTYLNNWYKWEEPGTTVTLVYSVAADGVCTITVGGAPDSNNIGKVCAQIKYTAKANTKYAYTFEAWTQSGARELRVQYYSNNDNNEDVSLASFVNITGTRKTYTIYGEEIPKGGIRYVDFQCANQTGTFYVKMLEIVDINDPSLPALNGNITISPSTGVNINTELIATYSGNETVSYQWQKDGVNVGTNTNKYTPTQAGSYTVTVSAEGYKSKASATVDVNDPSLATLSGNIIINPNSGVTTFKELTATYSGNETVSYQWQKDGSSVGTNSNKYTPTEAGSYTVTVSAEGYNSKTSDPVTITLSNLSGNIIISPSEAVVVNTELTATYSGSETVSYQWKKDGVNVGTNANKYTPTQVGSYSVTVSATGYDSKTSDAVTITLANLPGNITISPSGTVAVNTELTATYSGSETVSYQWKKDGVNVGTNTNKYTPTQAGSYTVTVSATGYNSKTSAVVDVNNPSLKTLIGTITISPNTGVTTFKELTAIYNVPVQGIEFVTLNYRWEKDGRNVGTNFNKYTPTEAGSYTVTISAEGYNSKTSDAVTVTLSNLSGNITINLSGTVAIYTELTATYSGSETVSYQWEKDGNSVGTNSNKFTPTEEGSYTVTVSAAGYNSKTSAIINVNDSSLSTLSGEITISPNSGVTIYTELTAIYSGSETVSYQWQKDGVNVGTNSNKFTPTTVGWYTVTVSAPGYNSKIESVYVSLPDLSGNITINPTDNVTTYTELTATYSGSETVSYQWQKDGVNVGTNSNKFTPTEAGIYTVTVSATGYNSMTTGIHVYLADLSGEITISPNSGVTTYMELTATYSGSETVTYQWKDIGHIIVGTNSNKYTPTTVGWYTVTVSAPGYNSKTSNTVTVTLSDLSGNITISPDSSVTTYTELTATYSGSETVSYDWKKDESIVGTNSNKYTPTTVGSYTVTVRAPGYNSKTSAAVTVTLPNLSGNITISPSGLVVAGTQLTVTYSGRENVASKYQWEKDGNYVGTNSSKYTPTEGGSYTVTVSKTGYNSKTSDPVYVSAWTAISDSTFGTSSINAIAYGLDRFFVAVGDSGKMAYSPRGYSWETAVQYGSTFGTYNIYAIAYGNNMFVAGGEWGQMATATNSVVTWTAVSDSTFSSVNINAIAYGNNMFVAVGDFGRMATSTNGTTWTAVDVSNIFDTSSINAIAYNNNRFVAVGDSGKMATSTDGVTWTAVSNSTFGTYDIKAITYGNNMFVAGGQNGKMATSTNGVTWTAVSSSTFGTSSINAIIYANNKFVAVGNSGKTAYSTVGTTWTAIPNSTFDSDIYAIAYGNDNNSILFVDRYRFVAVGKNGKMAYLTDW